LFSQFLIQPAQAASDWLNTEWARLVLLWEKWDERTKAKKRVHDD
jgi:hypothetical protein